MKISSPPRDRVNRTPPNRYNIIEQNILKQTATFRPRGLWGRLYWYAVLPFHGFIFRGMINKLVKVDTQETAFTT